MRLSSCLGRKERFPCVQEEDHVSMTCAHEEKKLRPKEVVLSSRELSCVQQSVVECLESCYVSKLVILTSMKSSLDVQLAAMSFRG